MAAAGSVGPGSPPALALAARMARVTDSAIMGLIKQLAASPKPPISFASGLPDPNLFPKERLARVSAQVIASDATCLQYGPTDGLLSLRKLVVSILARRGFSEPISTDNIVITTGSQQAIDLVARAMLNPNDGVAVESPTYLAALQVFSAAEAKFVPLDLNNLPPTSSSEQSDELLVQQLTAQLGQSNPHPKIAYITPNFANPTGSSTPLPIRKALRQACADSQVLILEDDAYHELSFDSSGASLPVCAYPSTSTLAVYTSTFSKSIAPGLRVGYLYTPNTELARRIGQLKQITDLHASTLSQRIVEGYLADPGNQDDLLLIRKSYKERRDTMLRCLDSHLNQEKQNGTIKWTEPGGGMFIFLTLPSTIDGTEFMKKCWDKGVVFVPGESFFPEFENGVRGQGRNTIRLNFVSESVERIQEGVGILARVLKEEIAGK